MTEDIERKLDEEHSAGEVRETLARDPDDADSSDSMRNSARAGLTAATALVILALAAGALAVMRHQSSSRDDQDAEALAEVGNSLTALLSWTPSTVADELADERKLLTGSFADHYAELVTKDIAPTAKKSGLSSSAKIMDKGVVQPVSGGRVVLLYFVNVTVTAPPVRKGSAGNGQRYRNVVGSRIEVTAVYRDGHWLIERYDPV